MPSDQSPQHAARRRGEHQGGHQNLHRTHSQPASAEGDCHRLIVPAVQSAQGANSRRVAAIRNSLARLLRLERIWPHGGTAAGHASAMGCRQHNGGGAQTQANAL